MTQESERLIGQLIGGRFKVLEPLGEGGMGVVVKARHEDLGNHVAIKVLKSEFTQDERMIARFRREARAASRIHHPNIVFIQDFGQLPDGRFYLVMEFVPGTPLDHIIRRGPLPLPLALKVLIQVADAMIVAHEYNVVHRDLKPENILLTQERNRSDMVKILDFGLAKILSETDANTLTLKGQIFGTPEYMSPEQCRGQALDCRSDIYSFGILAYEIVVGEAPFSGTVVECMQAHCRKPPPKPSEKNPVTNIPKEYDDLVLSCLRKEPDERPSNMQIIMEQMRRLRTCIVVEESSGPNDRTDYGDFDYTPATISDHHPFGVSEKHEPDAERGNSNSEWMVSGSQEIRSGGVSGSEDAWNQKNNAQLEQACSSANRPADQDLLDGVSGLDVGSGVHRIMNPMEISAAFQRRYRNHLKHVVEIVLDNALGNPGLALSMSKLLEHEEEILQQETEMALLESQMKEVDESARQRVNSLRLAVIDLSQERERLAKVLETDAQEEHLVGIGENSNTEGSTAPKDDKEILNDINYQIRVLENRIMEVTKNREDKLACLGEKLSAKQRENYERETQLLELEAELARQIHFIRERCDSNPEVRRNLKILDVFFFEMQKHSI